MAAGLGPRLVAAIGQIEQDGRRHDWHRRAGDLEATLADDLRRQADHFLELSDLADAVGRDPAQRPQRPMRDDDDAYEDEYEEL